MAIQKDFNFQEVTSNFEFTGEFKNADPYGFGHINDTFAAYFDLGNNKSHRYILQRINNNVFKDPVKLMENIKNVTDHLRRKIIECGGDPERETLNLIKTKSGGVFYIDRQGNYWRSYVFIEGAKTYQIVKDKKSFYSAGRAFGNFQKRLCDFTPETLHETIPDFHNTPKRLEAFSEAVLKDVCNRANDACKEIEFVEKTKGPASRLVELHKEGLLPLRVTHNDTKFNNVMIDDITGEGVCVIDLDTVMPGISLYDFGDAIRSGANAGAEDEIDLSKVYLNVELFDRFTAGYLEVVGDSLTQHEKENLLLSAIIMTLECGIRFLTDFLSGDVYFKIHRTSHNLDRARTQFKLVEDMFGAYDQLQNIVERYV